MSTLIDLLDQNFSANDVDIMVFEPSVLSPIPPPPQLGEIDDSLVFLLSHSVDFASRNSSKPAIIFISIGRCALSRTIAFD